MGSAAPERNFTLPLDERLRALAEGPPAYMRRRRRIEDLEGRLLALLGTDADPASSEVAALLAVMNDLIDRHNRYYPIEANLPVDPRTHRVLERGAPWRPLPRATAADLLARSRRGGNE